MAQDRLFHKRLGHGERVNQLSDFEYIVWGCYVLSADDFGVMRLSAVTLQADHDRLLKKSPGAIERALNRCVDIGLLRSFEHQGRAYVFQPDWQDYQKIRFPGKSTNPLPPSGLAGGCSEETLKLYGAHSEVSPKSLRKNVPPSIDLPTGNGNGNGNGNALKELPRSNLIVSQELADRGARLLERYDELYSEKRRGAKHFRRQPALDHTRAIDLCRVWDDARLEKLAAIVLTTDDDWISRTDRGFAVFASKASWADDRLTEWESQQTRSAS